MKKFLDKDFLLSSETAKTLYHNHAAKMPIIDYHCHIEAKEIAENIAFENIARLWLSGDHYKWRLMRANGVAEDFITGKAPDREKFQKWAQTLQKAIGNPLYHWSHLELQRYFGYDGVLNEATAQEIWDLCNKKLQGADMTAREIIKKSNVKLICTTNDPSDNLKWHKQIKEDSSFNVQVLPAWRPDNIMAIEKKPLFLEYIEQLSMVSDVEINSFADLKNALIKRLDFFVEMGTKASDLGLDTIAYIPAPEEEIEKIFAAKLEGKEPCCEDILKYRTALTLFLARQYYKRGWVMELHIACKRDNNTRAYKALGPNTGYDCIGKFNSAAHLADFLNDLEKTNELPKTIVYSLNPADDDVINTIANCFHQQDVLSKVQQGSAWWFNDHKSGMLKQMTAFASTGLLSAFIGMLTDSRSFLSYTRHEYFRRLLCDLIGGWVENGEYPNDPAILSKMVEDISYNNTVKFFGFEV